MVRVEVEPNSEETISSWMDEVEESLSSRDKSETGPEKKKQEYLDSVGIH